MLNLLQCYYDNNRRASLLLILNFGHGSKSSTFVKLKISIGYFSWNSSFGLNPKDGYFGSSSTTLRTTLSQVKQYTLRL